MTTIFISIGSNVDREHHIRKGVTALRARFDAVTLSPVYENPAVGFRGEPFYNLVARAGTTLTPQQVHHALAAIEAANGRSRGEKKFAPRTLDLDLLLYDDLVLADERLRLPRADITRYAFVLRPLLDLDPRRVDPSSGEPYLAFWEAMQGQAGALRVVSLEI